MPEERASSGGGEIAGTLDPLELRGALADLINARKLAAEAPGLFSELARIVLGISKLQFDRRDPRFADPSWHDHPVYRRLGQGYLLVERAVNQAAARPAGTWERQARTQYVANILTGAASPTNFLLGNPAALKRAFETGGLSLVRGTRNFLRDARNNYGMPRMVDRRPFTVGENLACSPGAVVHREEMFELLQYTPSTATVRQRPLLMVPPQVNKFYVADLAPGRSMVQYAVAQGVQTFMVAWRNPRKGETHGRWGLADYVSAQVRALDVVREITRSDEANVLGVCAGGLTTAVMLGYLAALGDSAVQSATFLVTLLASTHPNVAGMMATKGAVNKVRRDAAQGRVVDGKMLGRNFALMRPNDLVYSYVANNWLLGNDPPAFDILAWNDDTANLPSTFQRDTLDVLVNNKLMQTGAVTVLDTPVDLSKVDIDTFVAAGHRDHIAPWDGCYMTSQLFGGDTEVVIAATGHIQTLVNPVEGSRYRYWAGPHGDPDPHKWLAAAARHEGSWWPRWAEWLLARSGDEISAPRRLGSRAHPAGDAAPGRYVFEE